MNDKRVQSLGKKSLFYSLLLSVVLCGLWTPLRAQSGGFLYVGNANSNNVSAYAIDASTGELAAVLGSEKAANTSREWRVFRRSNIP